MTKQTQSLFADDVWDVKQATTTQNLVVGHEVVPADVQDTSLASYVEGIQSFPIYNSQQSYLFALIYKKLVCWFVNVLLQLMDELELILADTSNEELTPDKKVQYNNVRYDFSHQGSHHMNQYQTKTWTQNPQNGKKESFTI